MADFQTNHPGESSSGDQQWELLLRWPEKSSGSLHGRLRGAVRDAIRTGRLSTGATLPPSRVLAEQLGCSRWAVTEAYAQLVAEGYLSAIPGSGTTVAWRRSPESPSVAPVTVDPPPRYDLAPGLPDLRAFPRRRWAEALRVSTAEADLAVLGYPPPAGLPRLRRTLAEHVVRTRGARAEADDVIVTTSVTDAVRRLCTELLRRGVGAVAVEDPGWPRLRDVIAAAGLRVVPVPTDEQGLQVDALRRLRGVRVALVTAAHQFPNGSVLAPDRRADLLTWAEEVDGLVLEDDYDAEYRYDREPVATLQGMLNARVVLLKSVSKVLSPALGLGWMVAPRSWVPHLTDPSLASRLPPALDQMALARLLETGGYDRHLRDGRRRYRHRRDLLVRHLDALPGTRTSGLAAGLHLMLWLPAQADSRRVTALAASRGLRVSDLDRYRATDERIAAPALVLGYGNIPDAAIPGAVRVLESCLGA